MRLIAKVRLNNGDWLFPYFFEVEPVKRVVVDIDIPIEGKSKSVFIFDGNNVLFQYNVPKYLSECKVLNLKVGLYMNSELTKFYMTSYPQFGGEQSGGIDV